MVNNVLMLMFREDPFTRRPITITDIKFEMSCILYNIGALHSILGGMDTRQSPEVCSVSICSFCSLIQLLCFHTLYSYSVWCISQKVKMRLYKAIILSALLNSANVWPLTATLTKRLNAAHMS